MEIGNGVKMLCSRVNHLCREMHAVLWIHGFHGFRRFRGFDDSVHGFDNFGEF